MARRTKEDAEKTRKTILMAALDIISTKGLANTSLDQIANQAGVTRGAIYWHFKNKTALFEVILEQWLKPTYQLSNEWLTQNDPSLSNLKTYMVKWLSQLENQPELTKLFDILFFKVELIGDVKALIDQANDMVEQDALSLQFYLGALKAKNEIHQDTDLALLAISLSSFLMGLAQNWLAKPNVYSLEKNAKPLVEQFFKGYIA
ncbi:MAG: TetR family transcriptional regulator [Bermanella sp.]